MHDAKLFSNGRDQFVRLPEECRFTGESVFLQKRGEIVMLIPKENPWEPMADACDLFTADFMTSRDQGCQQSEDF